MLERLVEFSLTQRLLVVIATLALVGAGAAAFNGLPIDAYPDVSSTSPSTSRTAPTSTGRAAR